MQLHAALLLPFAGVTEVTISLSAITDYFSSIARATPPMQEIAASEDDEVFLSPPATSVAPEAELVDLVDVDEDDQVAVEVSGAAPPDVQEVPGPAEVTAGTPAIGTTPVTPNPFDAFDANVLRRSARRCVKRKSCAENDPCLLYTSDAADE